MTTVRGSGPYLRARIDYTVTKLTNGARVDASLYAENCDSAYFAAHVYNTYKLTVNGSQATGSGASLSGSINGAVKLLDKSVTINYTGSHSAITIKGEIPSPGVTINGTYITARSVSATVALPKVGSLPTKGTITAPTNSVISETATTIAVTWNKGSSYNGSGTYRVDVKINDGAYTFVSGDINFSSSSHPTSWTYTIPAGNRVQGTKFAFQMDTGNDVGWAGHTYSGTVTMNKLNPPAIGTINTFNPYTATKDSSGNALLNVPITGGSQTMGGNVWRFCDLYINKTWLKTGSNYQEKPTSNPNNTSVTVAYPPASFATYLGTGAYSGSFRIVAWLQNANGSRSAYVEKNFTVNLNSDGGATPSMASDAVTISGGKTATIFLVGKNSVAVSIASSKCATRRAPSGTSLSYKIECTGKSTFTGNSTNFSGMTAGKKTIKAIVTDSRGLASSQTKYVYFQPYSAPTAKIVSATRLDNPNTSATISYSTGFTTVKNCDANGNLGTTEQNGINSLQYRVNGGSWVTVSNPQTSGTFTVAGLSADSTHTIQLRVCDKMYADVGVGSNTVTIPTMNVGLALRKSRVGINCVPQSGEALSVNGYTNLKGNLTVTGTASLSSTLTVAGASTFTGLLTANGGMSLPNSRSILLNRRNTSWIGSATQTNNSIYMSGQSLADSYTAILGLKTVNGHNFSLGAIGDKFGVWGFKSGRTENSYDMSFWIDASDGLLYRQGQKIMDFGNYPEPTRRWHGKISGSSGKGEWIYLGHITGSSDTYNTYIDIYTGSGYNGNANQNSIIHIQIKDAWQSALSATKSQGVIWWCDGTYHNSIQVQVRATANNAYQIWVYLPWGYWDGQYEVYTEAWFNRVATHQTSAPTAGTAQEVVNITPDMRGYQVGAIIPISGSANPANLYGGIWTEMYIGIANAHNSQYYINNSGNTIANNNNIVLYAYDGSNAGKWHVRLVDKSGSGVDDTRWWKRTG